MNVAGLILFVYFLVTPFALASRPACLNFYFTPYENKAQISVYLKDTLNSIESLRGPLGLINDLAWVRPGQKLQIVNENTSGTNIAVDLLIQVELLVQQAHHKKAYTNISNILTTLGRLERHQESGLFFSWYSTKDISKVANHNLSSIDNLHLALALWTISENQLGSPIGKQARALFDSMDFSMFFEQNSGFISGNFTYTNGKWHRDAYTFSYLGSEARILYTAAWSLGLFKQYVGQPELMTHALKSILLESVLEPSTSLIRLWDGSAFQLLFPKMFIDEGLYSKTFKKMYAGLGDHMIAEGTRRRLPFPAAHSPGVNRIVVTPEHVYVYYNDKAGNIGLVSTFNNDINIPHYRENWERTFTPYALVMAATSNPARFLPILKKVQELAFEGSPLYIKGRGWLDGYNITGDSADRIVQAQLAVNQGMIGLALLQMNSNDGLSVSARALFNNPDVREKMQMLYDVLENRISTRKSQ